MEKNGFHAEILTDTGNRDPTGTIMKFRYYQNIILMTLNIVVIILNIHLGDVIITYSEYLNVTFR